MPAGSPRCPVPLPGHSLPVPRPLPVPQPPQPSGAVTRPGRGAPVPDTWRDPPRPGRGLPSLPGFPFPTAGPGLRLSRGAPAPAANTESGPGSGPAAPHRTGPGAEGIAQRRQRPRVPSWPRCPGRYRHRLRSSRSVPPGRVRRSAPVLGREAKPSPAKSSPAQPSPARPVPSRYRRPLRSRSPAPAPAVM